MLGCSIYKTLSARFNIAGLDLKLPTKGNPAPSQFIKCDITARDDVERALEDTKPDIVIHAAAWADVDGCEMDPSRAELINVRGTDNIVYASKKIKATLVYISTDFVFNGKDKRPYSEKDEPLPVNVYARTKLEGEKKVSALDRFVILRTSWLYGDCGKNFVDTVLTIAKSKQELKIVDDQVGTPTFTGDFSCGIEKMIDLIPLYSDKGIDSLWGVYHLSNKGSVSWFEYAKEILDISQIRDVKLIAISSAELNRPAERPSYSVLDNSKFETITAFKMRPWQEALKEYLHEKE